MVAEELREALVKTIRRCESSCRHRHTEQRVRLPRLARHERGAGWGAGRSNLASRLAIAKRLHSPALSSVPNGGEGDRGHGADGTSFRKD